MSDLEIKFMDIEIKSIDESEDKKSYEIVGYVGKFGNIDSYDDILVKGCVTEQVGQTIHAFYEHGYPIGAMEIVAEDDYGILTKSTITRGVAKGNELYHLLQVKAPFKMSIGFRTIKSEHDDVSGIRKLVKIQLKEGSFVAFAANEDAIILSMKSRHGGGEKAQNNAANADSPFLLKLGEIFKGVGK